MDKGNGSDQQAIPAADTIILSVQVRADGAMNFNSAIPVKDALKLLQNVLLEMMFRELTPKQETGRIVLPNISHGKAPDA